MEENQQVNFADLSEAQKAELILLKLHEAVNIMLCPYPPAAVSAIVSSLRASLLVQFGEEVVDKNYQLAVDSYRAALPEMRKQAGYEEALVDNHSPLALPGTSFAAAPQFVYPVRTPPDDKMSQVTPETKLIH